MLKVLTPLFAALLVGCGGADPTPDPGGGGDACTGAACSELRVTVAVNSPLPAALSCGGNVAGLEAFVLNLLDPDPLGSDACAVNVSASGVSGSCPDVLADRNVTVTLFYRIASRVLPVAEQVRLLEMPGNSPPTVALSFSGVSVDSPWDSDSDGSDNLAEWCAGTL